MRDVTGGSRLPFRIRPGAPTSSIDIAASGNVGIGTASPGSPLILTTAAGRAATVQDDGATTSNAQSLFLRQDGTGDPELDLRSTESNGLGYRDRNSDGENSRFRNTTGVGDFTATGIAIDTSGNVGVGTTTPTTKFDVNGTVRVATLGANPPANTVCFSAANCSAPALRMPASSTTPAISRKGRPGRRDDSSSPRPSSGRTAMSA